MEQQGPSIGSLVLVAVLAFLVPVLLNKIRGVKVPIAAGEIMVGILVGKSGLGLVRPDPTLTLFNFLGLASLMFLSGLEINLAALVQRGGGPRNRPAWVVRLYHPFLVAVFIFLLSLMGAYLFSEMLGHRGLVQEPLILTAIIATSGVTIIMPVLKDRELLAEPLGRVLFNTSILGDIVPLIGLTVLVARKASGSSFGAIWILVLVAVTVAAYLLATRLKRFELTRGLAHGTAQISVRAAFALMLVFVALAQRLGVEAILGAFLAGLLLSALAGEEREAVTHKLDALGFGLLIPIFFLMVGVGFDLRALISDRRALLMVPLLLAGTYVTKATPAAILWAWYPFRQAAAGMVLLTTQMSVTIAASAIALKVGAYGPSIHAAVILVAVLTALTGPVVFNRVLGEQQKEAKRSGYLLAGMNRMSLLLGSRLVRQGYPVGAVDRHPDRAQEFQDVGIQAVLAESDNTDALRQAGADRAQFLVAITEDEEANLRAARAGCTQFQIPRSLIFARTPDVTAMAQEEGVEVVNRELATVALVEHILHGQGAAALLTGADEELQLSDVLVHKGALVGKPLRDVQLPAQILVVSILRGHEKIIPHGQTVLRAGDRLTVVGPAAGLAMMKEMAE